MNLLNEALISGKCDLLERYLQNGLPVNKKDKLGLTPLHTAIQNMRCPDTRYEACKLLLDYGTNVNCCDKYKGTPLHYLFTYNVDVNDNWKLFDLLMEKGADINCQDKEGDTPLTRAVNSDTVRGTRKLLELGVKPEKETLIVSAIFKNNVQMAKLLLNFGANADSYLLVDLAVKKQQTEIFSLLIAYGLRLYCIADSGCTFMFETLCRLIEDALNHPYPNALESLLESVDLKTYSECYTELSILDKVYRRYIAPEDDRFLHRKHAYREMLHQVTRHVALLMSLEDTEINYSSLRLVQRDDVMRGTFEEFFKQIKLMKTSLVRKNFHITYFDLLAKKGKSLVRCCERETISAVSRKKLKKFPDFADKLIRNVKSGVLQRAPLDFQNILYDLLQSRLPYELIGHLCQYLHLKDLRDIQYRDVDAEIRN